MSHPTDDMANWMNMFRWIVKLIRAGYDVDEMMLVRNAVLETACGLVIEQVEAMLGVIVACFGQRFPPEILNAVLRLEELCTRGLEEATVHAAGFDFRCVRGAVPRAQPRLHVTAAGVQAGRRRRRKIPINAGTRTAIEGGSGTFSCDASRSSKGAVLDRS
jgi:hypothetical protein